MLSTIQKNKSLKTGTCSLISLYSVKKQSLCTDKASEVYDMFLLKTVHARFAVMFHHWKEANVKRNGQVTFCTLLKTQSTIKLKSSNNINSTLHLATTIGKRNEGPLSLPSPRGDSSEQDRRGEGTRNGAI